MSTVRMKCGMCWTPYGDGDSQTVSHAGVTTAVVYLCRVCGTEREVPVTNLVGIYGKRAANAGRKLLIAQAKDLEAAARDFAESHKVEG